MLFMKANEESLGFRLYAAAGMSPKTPKCTSFSRVQWVFWMGFGFDAWNKCSCFVLWHKRRSVRTQLVTWEGLKGLNGLTEDVGDNECYQRLIHSLVRLWSWTSMQAFSKLVGFFHNFFNIDSFWKQEKTVKTLTYPPFLSAQSIILNTEGCGGK